jgi:hypothetical protein
VPPRAHHDLTRGAAGAAGSDDDADPLPSLTRRDDDLDGLAKVRLPPELLEVAALRTTNVLEDLRADRQANAARQWVRHPEEAAQRHRDLLLGSEIHERLQKGDARAR